MEFERLGPIVIAFAVGYVFTTGTGVVEYDVHLVSESASVLVFGLIEGEYDVRVPVGILLDNGISAISGCIIMYKYLYGEVGLLGKKSLQAIAYERSMVVCEAADADQRSTWHEGGG